MRTYRLRLPSPALIVACLALFAALGGGAYAATSSTSNKLHFTTATLQNGWSRYGGAPPAGYAKDSSGIVHLRGGIHDGASNTVVFVLPRSMRPAHDLYLPIYTFDGSEGSLVIEPNGDVIPFGSEVTGYTGLDGISFAAGE